MSVMRHLHDSDANFRDRFRLSSIYQLGTVQIVWFWIAAIFKLCLWLLALVVICLTLWAARQMRKRAARCFSCEFATKDQRKISFSVQAILIPAFASCFCIIGSAIRQ